MRNPLLSVVGPTATGKTQFSLDLAAHFKDSFHAFDLISADSRQVFKKMEIGTGADIPSGFEEEELNPKSTSRFARPYFTQNSVRIHGIAIQNPNEDWSVAQFRTFAQKIMFTSWQENSLPIIVGGTGLYHQHIFTQDHQIEVPPNEAVRAHAERISLANLQRWVKELDEVKFAAMNNSDRHNPRRLIRIIEISLAENAPSQEKKMPLGTATVSDEVVQHLMIGLTDTVEHISERIEKRIKVRLGQGLLEEVQKLIADYDEVEWRGPAFSATGYKEVRSYLEDKLSYQQMQDLWLRREVQYAKRQRTWWKKEKGIEWFEIHEAGWEKHAIELISEWLYTPKHAQISE